MPAAVSASLEPGDRLPFCFGMAAERAFYSFDDQAGRPAVLILAGPLSPAAVGPLVEAAARRSGDFAALGADVRLLAGVSLQWAGYQPPTPGPALVHCPTDELFRAAMTDPGAPTVLVIDGGLRLVARCDDGPAETRIEAAHAALAALPRERAAEVLTPAPVLVVPGLFEPAFCRELMAAFEAGPHVEGAMASMDAAGQAQSRIDAGKKRRRDLSLDPSDTLHARVIERLDRRLVPEIKRAFQAEVAHIDRVLVARYDDTGGYFRRHRDNAAPGVAFREFALSVNLNTGEYDGGDLMFPEYNGHHHAPPAGAGIVFSASLLHEAAPVVRGRRYVLLTFLHSEAAERRRLQALAAAEGRAAAA